MSFLPLAVLAGAGNKNPVGQQLFEASGTFTAPAGVHHVSVVCVGGGASGRDGQGTGRGGGGGNLAYGNNIPVIPGTTYSVVVGAGAAPNSNDGGDSYFIDAASLNAPGGQYEAVSLSNSGTYLTGGGKGGSVVGQKGGGGAGGYSGNGGAGGTQGNSGIDGSGGGGGGGASSTFANNGAGAGGGVGLLGEGLSGTGGVYVSGDTSPDGGQGGSGGDNGGQGGTAFGGSGGLYGGGGAQGQCGVSGCTAIAGSGADGGVRIIWGNDRAFPSTNTGDL